MSNTKDNHIIESMIYEAKNYASKCQELGYYPDDNCYIFFNPSTAGFIYDGKTVSNSLIQNMLLEKVIEFVGMDNNSRLKYAINETN